MLPDLGSTFQAETSVSPYHTYLRTEQRHQGFFQRRPQYSIPEDPEKSLVS